MGVVVGEDVTVGICIVEVGSRVGKVSRGPGTGVDLQIALKANG